MSKHAALLLVLVFLAASYMITAEPAKGESQVYFSDHFDGNNIDAGKWLVQENTNMSGLPAFGGSVTVANSHVFLTSTDVGTSFPCVTSAFNPFPSSGDFAIEFDMTYTCISDWGSGLWISPNIFQIWAGGDYEQTSVIAFLLGEQIYQDVYGWEDSSKTHVFRLEYIKDVYTVFVDSVEVASASSQLRPDTVGFGHPPASYVPFPAERAIGNSGTWCSFKIGFISMRALRPAVISLSTSTSITQLGFEVDINGTLCNSEGTSLFGETVVLSYLIPGVGKWTPFTSATTNLDGSYSVAWLSTATGNFALKAEWAGNEAFAGTYVVKNISVIRDNRTNFFFVESNSTLSSLAFNSPSGEISFTVSGPSGTTGYVRFIVSKENVPDPSALKVYLNNSQLEYTFSSVEETWLLYFDYAHSTHAVVISVPQSPRADSSYLITAAAIVVLALAAPVGFIVMFMKRRKKPT